ncbi:MAG: AMP-binding protein [Gemmatimonadaceae bacterium]|nr:AMP-binding protein [Gemmatimonadaceae bacterium]
MSLLDLLDQSLLGRADTSALEVESGGVRAHFTFGALEVRSNSWAQWLSEQGIQQGDRVAFLLGNRVEVIDLWLACVKRGAICVPINVLYTAREIAHIVTDSEPTLVITTAARLTELPAGKRAWDVDVVRAALVPSKRSAVRCGAATPLALVYTSGTTGVSKGAILTHENFAANALALNGCWVMQPSDRLLCALPLFHVHGLGNAIHCWLLSGCHMLLVERFESARAAEWFVQYAPTVFFGVPTMYVRLLEIDVTVARAIGEQARLFVCGSAPLPAHILEEFSSRFGHVILERYGMTETLMNVSNPYFGERRAGTVGLPMPMTEVRIVDDNGHDVADGTSGELWVRGPNVCAGYWRKPEITAAAFAGGWFRTGDIGVRAIDGYITLEGRRSELIISGGFNIYPREIEEQLLTYPGIREATVVGVKDAARGEMPVAYYVSEVAVDHAPLAAWLRTVLASFKVPKAFVRVDVLPRTALGKVQKHLLPPVS